MKAVQPKLSTSMEAKSKIEKLKKQLRRAKRRALVDLIKKLDRSKKAGISVDVNFYALKALCKKRETRLYETDAIAMSNALTRYGIEHDVQLVFREVDPYSYWPGDEVSCYRDIIIDY